MQADKNSAQSRDRLHRASQKFSRWARGGSPITPPSGNPLLSRGLAAAGRPQDAQSILEFLLVSVPLLAMIFGILEIGLAFYESTNLDFAAQEAARTVSVCANGCDFTSGTTFYRDYNLLRAMNRVNLRLDNVEYILVHHVGEQIDDPASLNPPQQDLGRAGPDIYSNYKYHWQLYALPKTTFPSDDPRANTVPARTDGDPMNLQLADARCSQIPLLYSATNPGNCALAWQSYDDDYNGYRSNPCSSTDADSVCRKTIPVSDAYGQQVGTQTTAAWPGRYICVPTDRFYVQIVYRHNWITPFMPTINLNGQTQTLKGFGNTNSLILSSKAYQKVEPRQFAGASGTAGC